jgi:hypothetical protein
MYQNYLLVFYKTDGHLYPVKTIHFNLLYGNCINVKRRPRSDYLLYYPL